MTNTSGMGMPKVNHRDMKDVGKKIKMTIIALFLVAFIADANAAIREYQVREEFTQRDTILLTQLAPILLESNSSITWDEIMDDVNRISGMKN